MAGVPLCVRKLLSHQKQVNGFPLNQTPDFSFRNAEEKISTGSPTLG